MASATAVDKKEAFRALAEEQLPRLYSVARRLVGDDAEDAVQETLMKAYQKFDQLEDPAAGPAWLVSILVNSSRDLGRARAREPEKIAVEDVDRFSLYKKIATEDPFPYSDSLHIDFLERFASNDVRRVLLLLPEMYRIPLVLVHMHGFSTKEVAKITDAPLGTVLARLHRGRKLFEKTMWEYAERNGLLEEETR
ncbi:MAG: RNA polymerase sigma factor [Actinomycetota bacterium]